MTQVLLLNASYEPLNICHWQRAATLLVKGKAETVERNGREIHPGMPLPVVIRLLYYVKIPHKDIPLTRRNVMHRDGYTCQYCGKRSELTIDHVIPRSKGGRDTWKNVVVACQQCNVKKGDKTPQQAGMQLRKNPSRPVNFINFELSKQHRVGTHEYTQWDKYMYKFS
ncbi:MAG: HNH endonuclease [Candidatus Melainabacteria bacterium]